MRLLVGGIPSRAAKQRFGSNSDCFGTPTHLPLSLSSKIWKSIASNSSMHGLPNNAGSTARTLTGS